MVIRPARSVIISAPHVGVVVVDVFREDFEKGRLNLGAELPNVVCPAKCQVTKYWGFGRLSLQTKGHLGSGTWFP